MGAKGPPPALNEEHDAATRYAALLGGVKCAWCTVIILERSTAGAVLWMHGLCSECRRWVDEADALTTAPGAFPDMHDVRRDGR
jgi:hypothetical protein